MEFVNQRTISIADQKQKLFTRMFIINQVVFPL